MSKKREIDNDEKTVFRSAMQGVKRMPATAKADLRPKPPKPRVKKPTSSDEEAIASWSDHEYLEPLKGTSLVEFKRPGLQQRVLRKLRAGQYNLEATLDMHGMTVAQAKDSLYNFLVQCQKNGILHILIIHGKGSPGGNPILKNKLNHWLRSIEQVLAFCSATAKDGRSGAMYVLLKNTKGNRTLVT